MANPVPEIMPDLAKAAGARVRNRTFRFPEPGQQRSHLPRHLPRRSEGRATAITEEMKLAAANAIAALVDDSELSDETFFRQHLIRV